MQSLGRGNWDLDSDPNNTSSGAATIDCSTVMDTRERQCLPAAANSGDSNQPKERDVVELDGEGFRLGAPVVFSQNECP